MPESAKIWHVRNALIKDVSIVVDHNMLSAWVGLVYGDGVVQGFGGYSLYNQKFKNTDRNLAGHFIWRVMEIADVTSWDRVQGKAVRVRVYGGLIRAIGHIVEEKWFDPHEEFKLMQAADKKGE